MFYQPPYDDTFKTSALERLATAGYPSRRGALLAVSRAMGIPTASLRRWVIATSGDDPSIAPLAGVGPLPLAGPTPPLTPPRTQGGELDLQSESTLPDAIRAELLATLRSMAAARSEAGYKELAAGFGLLIDKLHLLEASGEAPGETGATDVRERLARLLGGEL